MKLSKRTIKILEHYKTINNSTILERGSCLRTISPTGTIFVRANIEEEIPMDVGIYDMAGLIKALDLFNLEKADVTFDSDFINVKEGAQELNYKVSEPRLFDMPESDWYPEMGTTLCKAEFRNSDIQQLLKAMRSFGYDNFAIYGREGKLHVKTFNEANPDTNVFSIELGETKNTFFVRVSADNIKILPEDYMMTISNDVLQLSSSSCNYWIALNT